MEKEISEKKADPTGKKTKSKSSVKDTSKTETEFQTDSKKKPEVNFSKKTKDLVSLGKKKGYITYEDIDTAIPPDFDGFDTNFLEEIYETLEKNQIKIIEKDPDREEETPSEKAETSLWINLFQVADPLSLITVLTTKMVLRCT